MLRRLTKIVGNFATTTTTVLVFRVTVARTVLLVASGTRSNVEGTRSHGTKVCINIEYGRMAMTVDFDFVVVVVNAETQWPCVCFVAGAVPGDGGGVARVVWL